MMEASGKKKTNSESVSEALVFDAKIRQCFLNADEDKDLAKSMLEVKKEFEQFDDLLKIWKVLFSDIFLKSFKKLKSIRLKKSVLNLLLKLSGGWRPRKRNVETISGNSSAILRQYKVEGLYVVCSIDIVKEMKYIQVLKIWDILPLEDIPILTNRLESIFNRYTDDFINRCNETCLDGDLEVPNSWPPTLDIPRFKDLSNTEAESDLVGDTSDGRSYVENSQVNESLLLMKFYSLSSGVVNHLLSDREGRELEIILYQRSTFILGRSGTGKTTVLTMKLFQKEQYFQLAEQGCLSSQNSNVGQSSSATQERTLHQLFVTVSPKLCFAIKQHVLHLKRFVGYSTKVLFLSLTYFTLGFVFSGDTAQTIARGIDFGFQDIRHLFYEKFVLESRGNEPHEIKEKGQISEVKQLTQNFRTHTGVLKLSQSIVELLYRFFPHSIDILVPETSLIHGEAPVVLESGEDENAIIEFLGNSGNDSANIVGFGAEQVILVRDDDARKEVSKFVGKHALVLTIVECKGLEFQDVLLYNFFGSSPMKTKWRVIYDYMKEQDLLDSTLPQCFPRFSEAKHNILCSELKQLYVAVTRTRQRLWVYENAEEISKPMFDYWKKKCLVQVRQLDDSLAQAMQVSSSPEEWKSRGIKVCIIIYVLTPLFSSNIDKI
ncbi:uncharacterized protein LOC125472003 [Pyrus x bretschneideri]|uniref:uncharacterized protein LOC125472003 n=1 Tax=Pyrus x bretschneideri TaxID=225117 RepID=UPI00202F82DD|nr:uncharacterized protein LOC125472003 [Pyrus x bretschneideri]